MSKLNLAIFSCMLFRSTFFITAFSLLITAILSSLSDRIVQSSVSYRSLVLLNTSTPDWCVCVCMCVFLFLCLVIFSWKVDSLCRSVDSKAMSFYASIRAYISFCKVFSVRELTQSGQNLSWVCDSLLLQLPLVHHELLSPLILSGVRVGARL